MTKAELQEEIRERIYENTGGEITGQALQDVLLHMTDTLSGGGGSGQDGSDGVGILDIVVTDVSSETPAFSPSVLRSSPMILGASAPTGKKITIILTDGRETSFVIENGRDGRDGADASGGTIDDEAFEEFRDEFERYKEEVSGRIETIRNEIEDATENAVGDALDQLHQTQQELADLSDRLNEAAGNAQDALDLARSLSGITGSGISVDDLEEILRLNDEFRDWMDDFSGKVSSLYTKYDDLEQEIGAAGIGISALDGRISVIGENLNLLSGTVGNVKTDWDASKGSITSLTSWYNESAGTYAELISKMDAIDARIENKVAYYIQSGGGVNYLSEYVDGKLAEFGRTIEVSGVDLTHIEEKINGLSASVTTTISRYGGLSGELVTISDRMDGLRGDVSRSLTVAESAMTSAIDMRDVWNRESGMIRTVTNLVIREDEDGPIYWYINPELEDASDKSQWVRVFYQGDDPTTGLPFYTENKDGSGTRYDEHVFPDYLSGMLSFIKQNYDQIELNVTSGDIVSLLRLEVTDGGSVIYMTADRVMIDADVIANSLIAKSANIGGVNIGAGMISAKTGSDKWALRGDGVLEATGAQISGDITANSLTLGSQSIEDYIDSQIPEYEEGITSGDVTSIIASAANAYNWVVQEDLGDYLVLGTKYGNASSVTISKQGLLVAKNAIISGTVYANKGVFNGTVHATAGDFKGSVSATSGYFNNISANNVTIKNSRFTGDITANSLTLGSQSIEDYIESQIPAMEDGMTSGDVASIIASAANAYNWVVQEDLGDYLVLGTKYGNASSVTISKQGLLVAKNAIISGTVFADRGVFNGTVHAKDGDFKGSVSATSGYFNDISANNITINNSRFTGDVTANSLTLGNQSIDAYLDSKNYATMDDIGDAEVSVVSSTTVNPDGSIRHVLTIGGHSYEWNTMTSGSVVALGADYSSYDGTIVDVHLEINGDESISVVLSQALTTYVTVIFQAEENASNDNPGGWFGAIIPMGSTRVKCYHVTPDSESIDDSTFCESTDFEVPVSLINAYIIPDSPLHLQFRYKSAELNYTAIQNLIDADMEDFIMYSDPSSYRFYVDKNGLLQANNAVIYGKVYASEGYFRGSVSADSGYFRGSVYATNGYFWGTIHASAGTIGGLMIQNDGLFGRDFSLTSSGLEASNATIYGTIRQPFGELKVHEDVICFGDEDEQEEYQNPLEIYDNVYCQENTDSGGLGWGSMDFKWDVSQAGRRITIVNNKGGKQITDYGSSVISAPAGYYFFEDGIATSTLKFSNEIIELLGYGESDNNVFYGYIVLSRKNMMTMKRYGHELRMLATGTITQSGASITNLSTFDGTAFTARSQTYTASNPVTYWWSDTFNRISCQKNSVGDYTVRMPSKWFKGMDSTISKNLRVMLTSRTPGAYVSYHSGNTSGFCVNTVFLGNYVDADVDFFIYNLGDWFSLQKDASIEVTATKQSMFFSSYSSTGTSQTAQFTISPSNATITTATTETESGFSSVFNVSYNSSSKTLSVNLIGYIQRNTSGKFKLSATVGGETVDYYVTINYTYYPPCNCDYDCNDRQSW